ncbi:hypothetical protein WA026_008623 [Henosepilachna vigintioctopunctata]|uniref:Tetraspanin n=1 Tax=Henosepilachna vigintioctopunctata TaxID=420089 RepID=A0AAW1UG11_9CUCU
MRYWASPPAKTPYKQQNQASSQLYILSPHYSDSPGIGTGFSTITTGLSVLSKTKSYTHFLHSTIHDLSTALITVGSITFAVAILGCFAGINDSTILLILFAIFLVAISVVEIVVAVKAGLQQYNMVRELQETMKNYWTVKKHKNTWDYVHREFKCCGTEGNFMWATTPVSCCYNDENYFFLTRSEYCDYQGKGEYIFTEGCLDKLIDRTKTYSRILMGISICSTFVKINTKLTDSNTGISMNRAIGFIEY